MAAIFCSTQRRKIVPRNHRLVLHCARQDGAILLCGRDGKADLRILSNQAQQFIVTHCRGVMNLAIARITHSRTVPNWSHLAPRLLQWAKQGLQELTRVCKQFGSSRIDLHYPISLGASFFGSNWILKSPFFQIASHASNRGCHS